MAYWVKCTLKSGNLVVINLDRIEVLQPRENRMTRMRFSDGRTVVVHGSPEDIITSNPMTR